ncbi:MAG: GTPase [Chloroflexota bacterium]|jgi:GTP-binding protein|nr:GTPase [Chloroflexota bacterium]
MSKGDSGFIDEARIFVKGGNGGNGIASFRRAKFEPLGGPDGGDGGRGGDVVLRGNRNQNTLYSFQHQVHFRADSGGNGAGAKQHGKRGADLIIDVPLGTVVSDESGFVAEILEDGELAPVVRGGKGGIGNVHFATSVNRAPRMARKGEPGEERWLKLELRTIGDVGFIGEPNAGKSSLLSVVSAATPEIADYPFTTLSPNLGVAIVDDVAIVAVDIPGLIEGAHAGVGLGHRFLRHVMRARVLVHVVDVAADDPVGSYRRVRRELELFDPNLMDKPELIAANKLDLPAAQTNWPKVKKALERERPGAVYSVSAATGAGIPELLHAIRGELAVPVPSPRIEQPAVRTYRVEREDIGYTVERTNDGFRVRGREAERIVAMANLDSDEGIADLQRQLGRTGLFRTLEREGVEAGDTVYIGDFELEWA